MIVFRIACCVVAIFAMTASSIRADDPCLGDEEEKVAKAAIAAMSKAEKSGQPAELFVASRFLADNDLYRSIRQECPGQSQGECAEAWPGIGQGG